jgi:hypothetical protein
MEEERELEFEQDAIVDQNDLDGEWIRQSGLYGHFASLYADELKKKDIIWLRKKVMKARLYNEYRTELTVNDKSPTDTRVDAAVHADPEYEAVSMELIKAEWRVNKCDAAKWSFEHKKKSLEHLSENEDKAFNMPDGYKSKRERIIDCKQDESEELDILARKEMARKMTRIR